MAYLSCETESIQPAPGLIRGEEVHLDVRICPRCERCGVDFRTSDVIPAFAQQHDVTYAASPASPAASGPAAALQTALLVAAHRLGVYDTLCGELQKSQPAAFSQMENSIRRLPTVAHRWIGEMEEIASTFEAVGVTPDFHLGAADMFRLVESADLARNEDLEYPTLRDAIAALAALDDWRRST